MEILRDLIAYINLNLITYVGCKANTNLPVTQNLDNNTAKLNFKE